MSEAGWVVYIVENERGALRREAEIKRLDRRAKLALIGASSAGTP